MVVLDEAARAATSPSLRIAVTLPGGISIGTFEAGAVSALLTFIQEVNRQAPDRVVVDVISGASAGALTGLLAARVLLAGDDPVPAFRRAWVDEPSLAALLGHKRWAPLSLHRARTVGHTLLTAPLTDPPRPRQQQVVKFDVPLGRLQGEHDPIERGAPFRDRGPLPRTTYLDWASYDLWSPLGERHLWQRAIEAALASAAHPALFPAHRLYRPWLGDHQEQGSMERPWYTDGGVLDNEPLGRCLDRLGEERGTTEAPSTARLVMVIRSTARRRWKATDGLWEGDRRPRWSQTLPRAFEMLVTQAVGEDMRTVEAVNDRLHDTHELAQHIASQIWVRAPGAVATITAALQRAGAPATGPRDLTGALEHLLRAATGLSNKQPIDLAVVESDLERYRHVPPVGDSVLQGGGFLDPRRREQDFAAGYSRMLLWLAEPGTGLVGRVDGGPRAWSVARSRVPGPRSIARRPGLGAHMHPEGRAQLARLALRTAGIVATDAVALRRARRRRLARAQKLHSA